MPKVVGQERIVVKVGTMLVLEFIVHKLCQMISKEAVQILRVLHILSEQVSKQDFFVNRYICLHRTSRSSLEVCFIH